MKNFRKNEVKQVIFEKIKYSLEHKVENWVFT